MRWIYLSPHFDDVVLSCGGIVWEQVQAGLHVESWTICAGTPSPDAPLSPFAQSLHERWGTGLEAVPARRQEDEDAFHSLGASTRYWTLPDCIYRALPDGSWLVNSRDDLWRPVHLLEQGVVVELSDWLIQGLAKGDALVAPLTLGDHVDHYLVRAAAERAARQASCDLWYYPDYPYAVDPEVDWTDKTGEDWRKVCRSISPQGLKAWQNGVASYASQISTFWSGREAMEHALEVYLQSGGGSCLYWPGPVPPIKNL